MPSPAGTPAAIAAAAAAAAAGPASLAPGLAPTFSPRTGVSVLRAFDKVEVKLSAIETLDGRRDGWVEGTVVAAPQPGEGVVRVRFVHKESTTGQWSGTEVFVPGQSVRLAPTAAHVPAVGWSSGDLVEVRERGVWRPARVVTSEASPSTAKPEALPAGGGVQLRLSYLGSGSALPSPPAAEAAVACAAAATGVPSATTVVGSYVVKIVRMNAEETVCLALPAPAS